VVVCDTPIDRPRVDKLIDTVSKFRSPDAIFVARGDFMANIQLNPSPERNRNFTHGRRGAR